MEIITRITLTDGTVVELPVGFTLVYGKDANGNMAITVNPPAVSAVPIVKAPVVETPTVKAPVVKDKSDSASDSEPESYQFDSKVNKAELGGAFFDEDDDEDIVVTGDDSDTEYNAGPSASFFLNDDEEEKEEEETTEEAPAPEQPVITDDAGQLDEDKFLEALVRIGAMDAHHTYIAFTKPDFWCCKQGSKEAKAAIDILATQCDMKVGKKFADYVASFLLPYQAKKTQGLYFPAKAMASVFSDKTLTYKSFTDDGKLGDKMFVIINGVPFACSGDGSTIETTFEAIDEAITNGVCTCTNTASSVGIIRKKEGK